MATRASKRRMDDEKVHEEDAPKAKRGRKPANMIAEQVEDIAKPRKTLGVTKKVGLKCTREIPQQKAPNNGKNAGRKQDAAKTKSENKRSKKVSPEEDLQDAQRSEELGMEDNELETSTHQVRRVKEKVRNILDVSRHFVPVDLQQQGVDREEDILDIDSDDLLSEAAEEANASQLTMDGDTDYQRHPIFDAEDSAESNADSESQNDFDLSRMRMVPNRVDWYNDPSKSHEQWWAEDPTREETLCQLWSEHPSLFTVKSDGHRIPSNRETIIKKFATILEMPPFIIHTRMQSIRNHFQKMHREAPSGSEPVGKTVRQKEILRLAYFLREHIKTADTITSYKGKSPANKKKYEYQYRTNTPRKSTPNLAKQAVGDERSTFDGMRKNVDNLRVLLVKNRELTGQDPDPGLMPSTSSPLDSSLTPIKAHKELTQSEGESTLDEDNDANIEDVNFEDENEEECQSIINTKHFYRNQRLHNKKGLEVSAKRSLRLSPEVKKASDYSKIKRSKENCSSSRSVPPQASSSTHHDDTKKKTEIAGKEKNQNDASHAHQGKPSPVVCSSALSRYKMLKAKPSPQVKKTPAAAPVVHKKNTVKHVVPPRKVEKKTSANLKKNQKVKDNAKAGPSQTSKSANENMSGGPDGSYDVGIELPVEWYEKQGPQYRKRMEEKAAAKKKEAETDPMVGVMKDKAETMKKMTEAMDIMANKNKETSKTAADATTAEQLWADSLVPHLMRMSQNTRDCYMVYVLGLAFKAISGRWPDED